MKKLFLLDGHALVYRAHYAFIARPLINSKGLNTSAISGFTRTLWDIISKEKPSHLAVAFDLSGPTFRHETFEAYKANREVQPEDITLALPWIEKIIAAFNIPIITLPRYEADDIIGTIAKKAARRGFTVYMVTPDKDYGQLVEDQIYMYKPSRQGNGIEIWGAKEVLENWGIRRVDQVTDVLGLRGDAVDNIPGVPGIGEKTAVKLLEEYDTIENLISHADKLSGKIKDKILQFADQARLSKELATIDVHAPIEFDEEACKVEGFDKTNLAEIFRELEFRSLAASILGASDDAVQGQLFSLPQHEQDSAPKKEKYTIGEFHIGNTEHKYYLVDNPAAVEQLLSILNKAEVISFDTETTGVDPNQAELVGLSFSVQPGEAYYVPIPEDYSEAKATVLQFKNILENSDKKIVGQNIKYDMLIMKWYGVQIPTPAFDTMIAHYLIEPDQRHKLDYLAQAYLNYHMIPIEELIGKRGIAQGNMRDVPVEKIKDYAAEDADITLRLTTVLEKEVEAFGVSSVMKDIELPLVSVLCEMEYAGVKIDADFLAHYSRALEKNILDAERVVFQKANTRFNISSPRQVGEVLFEKLNIPYKWKKTSTNQYSTDEEKLTELAQDYEIVQDILEYRKLTKLKSTYVDALPLMINPKTGRVHSSFNQARAATGRLASENPNLQNIPIKDEAGREIRKAFVPRDDNHVLVSADYSQIELRLIADLSNEEAMLDAFIKGLDIHRATASKIYGVAYGDVSPEQRRNAKTVNFSILYGAGSTNVSRQLGISRSEAKDLIDQYFKTYSGLKKYMADVVENCRHQGYVATLLGRKRILRDINSKNALARSAAERISVNTPIQGTAADLIKVAMINIHRQIKRKKMQSKMVLQVHDELVFDVPQDELAALQELVVFEMKHAIPNLKVPLDVGIGSGKNWLEAH